MTSSSSLTSDPFRRKTIVVTSLLLLLLQLSQNSDAFLLKDPLKRVCISSSIGVSGPLSKSTAGIVLLSSPTTSSSSSSSSAEQQQQNPKRRFVQAKTTVETLSSSSSSSSSATDKRIHVPNPYGSDSIIASKHKERLQKAGRVGTKSFVDPCKVFIGNLPFDIDDTKLGEFVLKSMGQSKMVLHASKVVYEWKTGKSKGYGFVQFVDPIYATICMDVVNGKTLQGRPVSVAQGKKKDQENQLYLKKRKKDVVPESDEDKAISSGLDEAEEGDDDEEADEEYVVGDLELDEDGVAIFDDGSSEDIELDAVLFGLSSDDDDDEEDDGIFLENKSKYEPADPNLNREQRRDVSRRVKRKKMPHKGFG
jgi:RNA recognition motif-containing protein